MMEAAPAASFKMAEPDLLLEILVITLDAPAQFGEIDQARKADVLGASRASTWSLLLPLGHSITSHSSGQGSLRRSRAWRCECAAVQSAIERHIRALSPGDRAPSLGGKAKGEVLDLTGRCAASRPQALVGRPRRGVQALGGKGPVPRPDRRGRQNPAT